MLVTGMVQRGALPADGRQRQERRYKHRETRAGRRSGRGNHTPRGSEWIRTQLSWCSGNTECGAVGLGRVGTVSPGLGSWRALSFSFHPWPSRALKQEHSGVRSAFQNKLWLVLLGLFMPPTNPRRWPPSSSHREPDRKELGRCAPSHIESAGTENQAQGLTADP